MQLEADTLVVPPRDSGQPPSPRVDPSARPRPDDPVVLRRWVGRYELIQRIAHGGMATVYLGRAKGKAGFEKIVAVKVIHPHLAAEAEFVGMFLDEARIAARIHHPHVVEILDLGESEGAYFMVMEFVEGENLAALVRALGSERLPVAVILQLMADTLEGLAAAHELRDADGSPYRLVHRDVSPHNILINLDGWAKVGDFGVMKAAGKASSTKTGELRGKLAYMSPEQARGDARVDHRTDLFALGVVGWELLTGQRLFACATEAATLEKVMACEVPPLADARPELGEHPQLRAGLDALLTRALAPEPGERWPDANAMLAEVKRLARLEHVGEPGALEQGDARAYLGELMRRFFLKRVDYARAALRRTDEHRTLTDTTPGMAGASDSQLASGSAIGPAIGPDESERPVTASQPSTASTITHVGSPRSQWLAYLLLPMLGAGIAIVVMLAIGPRMGAGVGMGMGAGVMPTEPAEPVAASNVEAEPPARVAPSELTPNTIAAPLPSKPPGVIRWWFWSTPRGAKVLVDGKPYGISPTSVEVPLSEDPIEIRLELDGYEPYVLHAPPANDQTFTPQLRALEQQDAPAKAASKRPRTSSKTSKADEQPTVTGKKDFIPVPDSLRDSGG